MVYPGVHYGDSMLKPTSHEAKDGTVSDKVPFRNSARQLTSDILDTEREALNVLATLVQTTWTASPRALRGSEITSSRHRHRREQ